MAGQPDKPETVLESSKGEVLEALTAQRDRLIGRRAELEPAAIEFAELTAAIDSAGSCRRGPDADWRTARRITACVRSRVRSASWRCSSCGSRGWYRTITIGADDVIEVLDRHALAGTVEELGRVVTAGGDAGGRVGDSRQPAAAIVNEVCVAVPCSSAARRERAPATSRPASRPARRRQRIAPGGITPSAGLRWSSGDVTTVTGRPSRSTCDGRSRRSHRDTRLGNVEMTISSKWPSSTA
jgi:hypothetical protein